MRGEGGHKVCRVRVRIRKRVGVSIKGEGNEWFYLYVILGNFVEGVLEKGDFKG